MGIRDDFRFIFAVQSHCSVIRWKFAPLAEKPASTNVNSHFLEVCGKYKKGSESSKGGQIYKASVRDLLVQ